MAPSDRNRDRGHHYPKPLKTALSKTKTLFTDLVDKAKVRAGMKKNDSDDEKPQVKTYVSPVRKVTQEERDSISLGEHGWGDKSWANTRGRAGGAGGAVHGGNPAVRADSAVGKGKGAARQASPKPMTFEQKVKLDRELEAKANTVRIQTEQAELNRSRNLNEEDEFWRKQ